jgi:phosphoglycerate kinase
MADTARRIAADAGKAGQAHRAAARRGGRAARSSAAREARSVAIDAVPADAMILDVGALDGAAIARLGRGADAGLERPARRRSSTAPSTPARRCRARGRAPHRRGSLVSVAGGGDTVAALAHAGVERRAQLRLDRGRRLPRVARGQDAARRRGAGDLGGLLLELRVDRGGEG